MDLLQAAIDDENLFEAWLKVRRNGGSAGVDGQSLDDFARNVFGRLQTLREQVMRDSYRPQSLLQHAIPKDDGGVRHLAVPTVRDRVLQTAVARVLTPQLEREFEHASYAYRAGRSVQMAIARVAYYRDQGFQWVVDADIQRFFDEVPHALLLDKLRRSLGDHSLLPLIELWLAATLQPLLGPPRLLEKGIPQGSPLSPVLANLYLDDLDEALLDENLRLVRFADDFLILCRNRDEAQNALAFTTEVATRLELRLNQDKTRIVHFDEGFRFLGVDFLRNLMEPADPQAGRWLIPDAEQRAAAALEAPDAAQANSPEDPEPDADDTGHQGDDDTHRPPDSLQTSEPSTDSAPTDASPPASGRPAPPLTAAAPDEPPGPAWEDEPENSDDLELQHHQALSPALRSLYISRQGVQLLKENERVVVARKGETLGSWPLGKLDEILILGNALVSTALLRHCGRQGINVVFAEANGSVRAQLDSGSHTQDLQAVDGQLALDKDPDLGLMLARALVDGKIHNQRILLKRYNRRRQIEEIEFAQLMMAEMQKKLLITRNLDEVRGCEGQAARLYFGALARLIPPQWQFNGRSKRPPADPVNALLSLGYGMLHKTQLSFIQRQKLNPWLGSLHASRPGHAALASDLIEEFRAPVVDTCVLQAVLEARISPADFYWEDGDERGCRLNREARRRIIELFAAKYRAQLLHPRAGTRMDYHRAMLYQVNHYRQVVLRRERVYHPFKLR